MPVCDVCGKIVKDLRRHKARGRCGKKGKTTRAPPRKYQQGTPEFRLGLDL